MAKVNPEIEAMSTCYEALQPIEDDGKERVINWLLNKFGLKVPASQKASINNSSGKGGSGSDGGDAKTATGLQEFETAADLFSKAKLDTENDKVLIVAAFLQVKGNLPEISSSTVQAELKNMGHAVSNITRYFTLLGETSPKYIVQTKKSGKTQQARKKYKVTTAGIKAANDLLKDAE